MRLLKSVIQREEKAKFQDHFNHIVFAARSETGVHDVVFLSQRRPKKNETSWLINLPPP